MAAVAKKPSFLEKDVYLIGPPRDPIKDVDGLYRLLGKMEFPEAPREVLPIFLELNGEGKPSMQPYSEAKRSLAEGLTEALKGTKEYWALVRRIPKRELVKAGPIRDAAENAFCSEEIFTNRELFEFNFFGLKGAIVLAVFFQD